MPDDTPRCPKCNILMVKVFKTFDSKEVVGYRCPMCWTYIDKECPIAKTLEGEK